jgi:glycosyltransferase involved in cell wall biosynthesis
MHASRPPAARIALLVHSLNDGGAQRRLVTLANGFADAGREVDFLFVTKDGPVGALLDPRVRQRWLGVIQRRRLPLHAGRLRGARALARYLSAEEPDVLLAGSTNVHMLGAVAGRRRASATRLVLRASRHPRKRIPRYRLLKRWWDAMRGIAGRWAYDRADGVIAVSAEVGAALVLALRHPERCATLANPVVTPAFLAALGSPIAHPWLDQPEPLLVAAGRLVAQKDFATLLRALAELRAHVPARLLLFGDGPQRAALEAQIRRLELDEAVRLMGRASPLAPWLARADVVVSSSIYEGSPGVLVEAIAAGTPVVATNCPGGSVELLSDRSAGRLVAVRDWRGMARAIRDILHAPRNAEAHARIAAPYRSDCAIADYLRFLDAVVRETA